MAEIAKCRMCGAEAELAYRAYWRCSNENCQCCDPVDDPDGAKWNALMSPTPTEPRAETVRKVKQVCVDEGNMYVVADDGSVWGYDTTAPHRWRRYPPLPQPTEIPGTVEASDE